MDYWQQQKFGKINKIITIRNVNEFMYQDEQGLDAQLLLDEYESMLKKHCVLELLVLSKRVRVRHKWLPMLQHSLDLNQQLLTNFRKEFRTWVSLTDSVMVQVKIKPEDQVLAHLGASVLLPCDHNQFQSLALNQISLAQKTLKALDEELETISQQILTIKSNMRKVHDWQQSHKGSVRPKTTINNLI